MNITSEQLLKAYQYGLFPMAEAAQDKELFWVNPEYRGIIPLNDFYIPRRLARVIQQSRFNIRVNTQFEQVINNCAQITEKRKETWINLTIKKLYKILFDQGYCHSVECWYQNQLVGGLYGVCVGSAFFGESMFSYMTDASKVALAHLVERLKIGGFTLLDTQFVTDHLKGFGAIEISRQEYLSKLQQALQSSSNFFRYDQPKRQ